VKLPAHRAGLPGNVVIITGSAFLPAYLPTGRQGGASSRLAREGNMERLQVFPVLSQCICSGKLECKSESKLCFTNL